MASTRSEIASPNPPSERARPREAVDPRHQLGPVRRLEGLSLGLRIFLGLVAIAPLVLAAWAAIEASSRMGAEGSLEPSIQLWYATGIAGVLAMAVAFWHLLVRRVGEDRNAIRWIFVIAVGFLFVLPIYWWLHILPDDGTSTS